MTRVNGQSDHATNSSIHVKYLFYLKKKNLRETIHRRVSEG